MAIDFEDMIREELSDPDRLRHMREAFRAVLHKQAEKGHRIPDLEDRKKRLRATRERSIPDRELHRKAFENLKDNGFRLRFAGDSDEAVRAVLEELGNEKLLIKSKTNLSKEIELTSALGDLGVEVVETDIGDRIIQLSGRETVHPTGPCAQLDRYDIAEMLAERTGVEVEPDPHSIIEVIREEILSYIDRARIGLTGVNAVAAQEGAVVLLSNEGNIDLVTLVPGKLIILASIDKIYPDLEESLNMAKLQTFYSTGEPLTQFIRIITGPSKTADIEKKLYEGLHGPRELVVIFVDNGRSDLLEDENGRELLYCIGCGACLLDCPPYSVIGPLFGRHGHLGGIGACVSRFFVGTGESVESGQLLCTSCGACASRCPVGLDIPRFIERVRSACVEEGLLSPEHMMVIDSLKREDNVLGEPKADRGKWAEGLGLKDASAEEAEVLLHAGCRYSYDPDLRESIGSMARLLQSAAVDFSVAGSEESCCGGRALKLGYIGDAQNYAEDMLSRVRASGAKMLVTPCADCYATFKYLFPQLGIELPVEIVHTTELLERLVNEGRLALPGEVPLTVTYHDPCNLGRMMEVYAGTAERKGEPVYGPPRRLLEAIPGLKLSEMERSRESSWCCGAGAGVMEAFPELTEWIAGDRINEAVATGADALVASCPWCLRALRDALGETEADIQVLGLAELLARSAGLQSSG